MPNPHRSTETDPKKIQKIKERSSEASPEEGQTSEVPSKEVISTGTSQGPAQDEEHHQAAQDFL